MGIPIKSAFRVKVLDRAAEEIGYRFLIGPQVNPRQGVSQVVTLKKNGSRKHGQHVSIEDRIDALRVLHVQVHPTPVQPLDTGTPLEGEHAERTVEYAKQIDVA